MKKQNEKGITLIALIITIIVMLILVAVTVNVAINGGLFKEASDAAKDTERDSIYEQIQGALKFTEKGFIDTNATVDTVNSMFEEVEYEEETGILSVTGKKETYKYTLTSEKFDKSETGGNNPGGTVTNPNLEEEATWSNVSLAANLTMPQSLEYCYITIGSAEIEFDNSMIEDDDKYPGVGLTINGNRYLYSWGSYTIEDEENGTIYINEGWQTDPWYENQEAPDISTIRLNGIISFYNEDKGEKNPPSTECEKWFVQN